MKNIVLIGIFSLSALIFQSCATFNSGFEKGANDFNITALNGKYSIIPIVEDSIEAKYWIRNNFFYEIDRSLLRDTLNLDTLNSYQVEIEIINDSRMQVNYIENDIITRTRTIKTKLKDDGFLYLKNKNIGFIWIPFILGALDVNRSRITTDNKGNLIMDVSNFRGGAALLIIFLDWGNTKYRKIFKRIE